MKQIAAEILPSHGCRVGVQYADADFKLGSVFDNLEPPLNLVERCFDCNHVRVNLSSDICQAKKKNLKGFRGSLTLDLTKFYICRKAKNW